jgi:hypothetical protein
MRIWFRLAATALALLTLSCHNKSAEFELDPLVSLKEIDGELPSDAIPFKALGLKNTTQRLPASEVQKLPPDYKPGKIFSIITDPGMLQFLETRGFGLGLHFRMDGKLNLTTAALVHNPAYASIMNVIANDLEELMQNEKRHNSNVGVGMQFERRIFDVNWMRSKIAEYQLIGVINRLDRVAFDADTCGELRFLYRLAYNHPQATSRLPMTLLVMYKVDLQNNDWDSCKRMVKAWTYPDAGGDFKRLAAWMTSEDGPLASEFIKPERLHAIEVNLQAMRIPSTARPDIGSHAEYLLRVFKPDRGVFKPQFLENTPDVSRIKSDPQLYAEFKALMKDRHEANRIDHGIFQLDEKFLAKRAYSYSPMGLNRLDNRLYSQLLKPEDFDAKHFTAENRFVRSPEAAIRRLNDLSCVGCHQGRATAGFHFLGIDRPQTHFMNALKYEGSGHFQLELIRRAAYLNRVSRDLIPDPGRDFSYAPPLKTSEQQKLTAEYQPAGLNHFCGLPGQVAFEKWKCGPGLACVQYEGVAGEKDLGKCMPLTMPAGSACQSGFMNQADHHVDTFKQDAVQRKCGNGSIGYRCSVMKGGFPNGSCSKPCENLNSFELCGWAPGANFSRCLAAKKPIDTCYVDAIPSGRGRCNDRLSCRNDYVCERAKTGLDGYCTPTYSMGQIRLDGHVSPL